MSAVGAGVLAKLEKRLPNQIGNNRQWSSAYIAALTLAAAHAAEERIGLTWVTSEISLTDGTNEYALDSKFVEVVTVEFALDGTTFDRELKASTLDDLDEVSAKWRVDGGYEPTRYALFSTPGTQPVGGAGTGRGCRLIIHRVMSTAGAAKVRVMGWGIGTASTNVPDDVQERVLVPYIMAILRAEHDVKEAKRHYKEFQTACDTVKGRFISPYADSPYRPGSRG